ncbi:MAG: efflux RND transporter periplasmic adaptor subunit [Candidatus Acidiferrales bacterium]
MTEPLSEQQQNSPGTPRRSGRGKLVLLYLVPFVIFAALGFYTITEKRNASRVLAQQTTLNAIPILDVVHATPLDAASDLALPGSLEAYVESPIYARTDGYLKKWYRDIGTHVKQGELLAEIETPEVDQQLSQARADLTTAQANLTLAAITASRYQDLLKTDSVSKQEVDNANGDLAAKKSIVQSSEANVKRLEDLESFKRVYAPFSGVITQRNVDPGTLINAGNGGAGKSLFALAQVDPLRVFVAVPQSYAPSVRIGERACLELTEFTGKKFCGQVARTADSMDPATRTLRTEVDVPNSTGTLLPGSYAEVHFDLKISGGRLSLPVNALLFRPDGTMAAVVSADNHIELRRLIIGRDFGSSVEVLQGIEPSDAVVLNPPDSLETGEPVHVKQPAPKQ